MAGGERAQEEFDGRPSPEELEYWERSVRRDLANVYGFAVTMPIAARDAEGTWRYGLAADPSFMYEGIIEQFKNEFGSFVTGYSYPIVERRLVDESSLAAIRPHDYQIGPASQSLPTFFYEVYKSTQPFVGSAADIIALGVFFRSILKAAESWSKQKQEEANQAPEEISFHPQYGFPSDMPPRWHPVSAPLSLTAPALVAMCFEHLTSTYGVGKPVETVIHPRSWFYGTVDHPEGRERYLIVFSNRNRQFMYEIDGGGTVHQHYLATGGEITMLTIPNLADAEHFQSFDPTPSIEFCIE